MTGTGRVCVGQIVAAHGVRGLVKLRSFTEDPGDVVTYGPLSDESGRRGFRVSLMSEAPGQDGGFIARVEGVADRNAAEALRGTRLYVDRTALPEPEEDEFYHADLIGLRVDLVAGGTLGTVLALHDFGAGDMLEVRRSDGGTVMIPFTRAAVPVVDVKGGRVVVDPPEGLLEPAGDGEDTGSGDARDVS